MILTIPLYSGFKCNWLRRTKRILIGDCPYITYLFLFFSAESTPILDHKRLFHNWIFCVSVRRDALHARATNNASDWSGRQIFLVIIYSACTHTFVLCLNGSYVYVYVSAWNTTSTTLSYTVCKYVIKVLSA